MNRLFVIISLLLCLTDANAAASGKQSHAAESKTFTNSSVSLTLRIQDTKEGAYLLAESADRSQPLPPDALNVTLNRMGGRQENIRFETHENGLRSTS